MATRERIRKAVSDADWQEFRKALKGSSTAEKLDWLERYYKDWNHDRYDDSHKLMNVDTANCDICIRVDNYLKALMRGGQLEPFLDLSYFVHCSNRGPWRDTLTSRRIDGHWRQISVIRK